MKALANIKKEDVTDFFNKHIHHSSPHRAKFSIHLRSKKPRDKKLSEAAMIAFEQAVQKHHKLDLSQWREELFASGEPDVRHAAEYFSRFFLQETSAIPEEAAEQLLADLARFADAHPSQADYEGKIKDSVVRINDPKAYKASLRLSDPPKPVVQWNDLPVARF